MRLLREISGCLGCAAVLVLFAILAVVYRGLFSAWGYFAIFLVALAVWGVVGAAQGVARDRRRGWRVVKDHVLTYLEILDGDDWVRAPIEFKDRPVTPLVRLQIPARLEVEQPEIGREFERFLRSKAEFEFSLERPSS